MNDIVSKAKRSEMMSRIRSRGTAPELLLRKALHAEGFRFRLHAKLPGTPDIVLPRYKTAVFVHGCFWHRHENCKYTTTPKTNPEFWQEKFRSNVARDLKATKLLKEKSWNVVVVWECQLSSQACIANTVNIISEELKSILTVSAPNYRAFQSGRE